MYAFMWYTYILVNLYKRFSSTLFSISSSLGLLLYLFVRASNAIVPRVIKSDFISNYLFHNTQSYVNYCSKLLTYSQDITYFTYTFNSGCDCSTTSGTARNFRLQEFRKNRARKWIPTTISRPVRLYGAFER